MKYAKNNVHSRFYIFIILKTEFFRKGVFSQSLVFLCLWKIAIGARFCLCRTEKGRTMCAPTVICKCRLIKSMQFANTRSDEFIPPSGKALAAYKTSQVLCEITRKRVARHCYPPGDLLLPFGQFTLCRVCVELPVCVAERHPRTAYRSSNGRVMRVPTQEQPDCRSPIPKRSPLSDCRRAVRIRER